MCLFMTSTPTITPSPSQSNLNLTLYQTGNPSILSTKNVSFQINRKRKETNFYFSGTQKETTFHHCRLILETETEPGTKSYFHYLCIVVRFWFKIIKGSAWNEKSVKFF